MNLVVDTSIIISVITNESHKNKIIKKTIGKELIAPLSLHWEIANAFSAMFKRNKISLSDAKKALKFYQQIPLRLVEVDQYKSLEICAKHKIYAYDSYFIVCCKQFNCDFITLDKKLALIAQENDINILGV